MINRRGCMIGTTGLVAVRPHGYRLSGRARVKKEIGQALVYGCRAKCRSLMKGMHKVLRVTMRTSDRHGVVLPRVEPFYHRET